ncbi:hypothetical protein L917_04319, partial [Phytophthora nicotianae]
QLPIMATEEENEEFAYSAGELDDEEEDDVDWEDVGPSQQPSDPLVTQPDAANSPSVANKPASQNDNEPEDEPDEPTQNLQQIDWEQVNRSLTELNATTLSRKRRRPSIRLTKDEKQREKALHQTHLLVLLATRIKWTQLSRSQLLQGLLLSITATSDIDFLADMKQQPISYSLELLVRWFTTEFQLNEEVGGDTIEGELMTESSLMNVFFARVGQDYELAVLFAALCGALQLRYRLTCALDPLLVQRGKAFESSFKQRPTKRRRAQTVADRLKKKALSDDAEEKREVDEELEPERTDNVHRVFWLWCEVLDEKSNTWIHVDPVRRLVNRPQDVESLRGKTARFSYVVSIQDDGLVVDVTSRYTAQWSKSLELRLADSWLTQVIEQFNEDTMDQRPVDKTSRSGNVEKSIVEEKKKLETLKLAEGMPTSLEGFRKHHLYILEHYLGQFECLHPRKAIGLFKGQPVFLREHVQPLESAFKWRRLGREVKESERQKPAKWQSKGNDNDDSDASEEGKPSGSLALFGLWQTTEFEPLPMINGHIPKNKYGNIEIWSPAHIPRGAVHLRLPRIDSIAESLGIDFAPAVVGFEVRNGRPMPKMSGIVVAQSHEEMLLDAHAERQQQTIEKAIAHNQKLVLKRWENLTKRLLLRQRLEDDYGAV